MIFLFTDIQAPAGIGGAFLDYGILGIFCAMFAGVIAFMGKQFLSLHKRNESRIKELEEDLQKYLAEDRAAIIETLKDCNETLKNNNRVIEKISRIIDAKTTKNNF